MTYSRWVSLLAISLVIIFIAAGVDVWARCTGNMNDGWVWGITLFAIPFLGCFFISGQKMGR